MLLKLIKSPQIGDAGAGTHFPFKCNHVSALVASPAWGLRPPLQPMHHREDALCVEHGQVGPPRGLRLEGFHEGARLVLHDLTAYPFVLRGCLFRGGPAGTCSLRKPSGR